MIEVVFALFVTFIILSQWHFLLKIRDDSCVGPNGRSNQRFLFLIHHFQKRYGTG
ncbi:hypothetical protein [Xanthocytophaga flava]|uniref:hypothetical protein n=1 Tax=Xanthocytophaga flava TaxID=3048013 RepID=UPI0028D4788E|nr:hypothetical protein [Xanthocytophaga flavus]